MSEDQHTQQDPTSQYGQQSGQPAQQQISARLDRGDDPEAGPRRGVVPGQRPARPASGRVITGGDSGIGRAVAIAFAREGADVLISYLAEEEDADARETVAAGRGGRPQGGRGPRRHPRRGALPGSSSTGRCSELGGLDILVNNAAYQMAQARRHRATSPPSSSTGCSRPTCTRCSGSARRPCRTCRAGSAIINTSSIQAYDPSPQLLDYATTKAGIANFTKAPRRRPGRAGHPGQRGRARARSGRR